MYICEGKYKHFPDKQSSIPLYMGFAKVDFP